MPLMACPKCGQNVSSLASVCPNCSYSLREKRLKEGQLGPQITCRKCGHKISAKSEVCPHCGIDHPRRSFNLLYAAIPVGVAVILYAVIRLLPTGAGETNHSAAPPPLDATPPEISPPETQVVLDDSAALASPDTLQRARPIVVDEPPTRVARQSEGATTTTRWTATWVNVRRDPSPNAPIEQQLDPGVRVEVGMYDSGFWEVFIGGRRLGYVANSLLLRAPPEQ